jgi:hypothetical protein
VGVELGSGVADAVAGGSAVLVGVSVAGTGVSDGVVRRVAFPASTGVSDRHALSDKLAASSSKTRIQILWSFLRFIMKDIHETHHAVQLLVVG